MINIRELWYIKYILWSTETRILNNFAPYAFFFSLHERETREKVGICLHLICTRNMPKERCHIKKYPKLLRAKLKNKSTSLSFIKDFPYNRAFERTRPTSYYYHNNKNSESFDGLGSFSLYFIILLYNFWILASIKDYRL